MLKEELGGILSALNQLEQSASLAQKYGPYFFALALLVIAPFICRKIFQESLHSADADERLRASQDFRFYFRLCVVGGMFCVFAGVGWWTYENYRERARTVAQVAELKTKLEKFDAIMKGMNFAAYGTISDGVPADDVLIANMFDPNMSIVFAKLPNKSLHSEASWFFVVLSKQELPPTLEFNVGWRPHEVGGEYDVRTQLMLGKNNGQYKFSPHQDPAIIRPIAN